MEKDTLVKKVAEDTINSFRNRRKPSGYNFFQEAYDFIQTVILKQSLCFDKEVSEYIKEDEYRRQNFWECVAKEIEETAKIKG